MRTERRDRAVAAVLCLAAAAMISPVSAQEGAGCESPCELWSARYDSSTTRATRGTHVAVSPDGNHLYTVGISQNRLSQDVELVSYNTSDGSKRWESVNVSDSFSEGHIWPMDVPEEIALDPSGSRLFIVLNNGIYYGDGSFSTVAYDTTTGERTWAKTFSNYTSRVHAVAVSHDGERVFVLGTDCFDDHDGCTHKKLVVVAYDTQTGEQLWANAIPGRKPGDIRVGHDDRTVYIVGVSRSMNLAAFDAEAGGLSWAVKTAGRKTAPQRVLLSDDGSTLFLAGSACVRQTCRTRDYYIAAHDEKSGDQRWVDYYDIYDGDDRLIDAELAGDQIVLSGTSFPQYSGDDKYFFTVAAREETGKTIWERFTAERSEVSDLAVSGDGAVAYVTGTTSTLDHGPEQLTIAYELETGAGLWSRPDSAVKTPPYSIDLRGPAVAAHPSSDQLFLVGGAPDGDSAVAETRAIDGTTGASTWSQRHNGIGEVGSSDILIDMAVAGDGSRVFAVGESSDGQDDADLTVVALDPSSGATTWVRRDSSVVPFLIATAEASPDGSQIVVAGSSDCCGDADLFAASYDGSTGEDLWRHRLDSSKRVWSGDEATTIAFPPDGEKVYVAGRTRFRSGGYLDNHLLLVALDSRSGQRLWSFEDKESEFSDYDQPLVVLDQSGDRLFVVLTDGEESMSVLAFDTGEGTVDWNASLPFSQFIGADVHVSPDGHQLFITASAGNYGRFLTMAIDSASGDLLWQTREKDSKAFNGGPVDLDLSTDGSALFVTGRTYRERALREDILTVSYAAENGARRWSQRFTTEVRKDEHVPMAVVADRSGETVAVIGQTGRPFIGEKRLLIVGYDADSGEQQSVVEKLIATEYDYFAVLDPAMPDDRCSAYLGRQDPNGRRLYDFLVLALDLALC